MKPTFRKVKILATLGPASSSLEKIQDLVKAGVNVFRLNFSHGTHEGHAKNVEFIRSIEKLEKKPLGVLVDLQGPKLRVGQFETTQITLEPGQEFTLDLNPTPGDTTRAHFPHEPLYKCLEVGTPILLVDGKIRLKVKKISKDSILTKVEVGGVLSNNQGVNVPEVLLPISALTDKDRKDLKFALTLDIDFVALSFVQQPKDVLELRAIIKNKAKIISKIEKPQAIQHLEEIVDLSDGIMVARGDLGVEFPPEKVPALQKKIVHTCRSYGKPVIIATQMLESMIQVPTPTRAEASDVATAVYDGADAVMLSAESASGKYPVEAVEMMSKIISSVEQDLLYSKILDTTMPRLPTSTTDGITNAARSLAQSLPAALIVTFTDTGGTALRTAHKRPPCPILAMTVDIKTTRFLTIVWGVLPILIPATKNFEEMIKNSLKYSKELGLAKKREKIITTFGIPFGEPGSTNSIHVEEVI